MILVTGGTGLVGSHLLFELSKNGQPIRALFRDATKITAVKKLFDYYSGNNAHSFDLIEWFEGDVLDLVSLEDAFQGIDIVYHCAAKVSFAKKDFKNLIHVNRLGTANMVNFALKFGVKKFGHVSSVAAIGAKKGEVVTEDVKWANTEIHSGYAISKYNSEREVWRGVEEGLDVIIINPTLVFGAGNLADSSLAIFNEVKKGLKVYSPGTNAIVDARDVATIFVQLMQSETKNERFVITAQAISFRELLTLIAKGFNRKAPCIKIPYWLAASGAKTFEFLYKFTKATPIITYESTVSAYEYIEYCNKKVKNLLNYKFIKTTEIIDNVIRFSSSNEHFN